MQDVDEPCQIKVGDLVTLVGDPDLIRNGHCSIVVAIKPPPETIQNCVHTTVDVLDNDGSAWSWFDWQLTVVNSLE